MMMPPWVFVVFGVCWFVAFVLAWSLARTAARSDHEDELRVVSRESVRPTALVGAGRPVAVSPMPRPGRDGQRVRRDLMQERAARDALRCSGARVDAAPVNCPISDKWS